MRKPGEPIYLRKHMLALFLTVVATVALPRIYELMAGPLSFEARWLSGMVIAVVGAMGLYVLFRGTAANEPEKKE